MSKSHSRVAVLAVIISFAIAPLVFAADTIHPTVNVTAPIADTAVGGTITLTATASDNVSVKGVQFILDETTNIGPEDTTSPYSMTWNSTTVANGLHTISARARDNAKNTATSIVSVLVDTTAPPAGTITINNGAALTNRTAVTLTLSASDGLSSITQMRLSNTTTFSTAQTFATTTSWTLATGSGTKTVYVQFKDAAGNWSPISSDTIVLDTTTPGISGVTASSITGTGATISWTTNEPATTQLNYGTTASYGATTTLDSALITNHSVVLTGLNPGVTYNYRVRSRDEAGNEAIGSNFTFTTTAAPDTTAPSVPTNLSATPVSDTQINLSWTASTDNVGVTGYELFRDGVQFATANGTSFSNINLTAATMYSYAVRAIDAAGNRSALTSAVSARTQDAPVPPPPGSVALGSHAIAWVPCSSAGPVSTSPITTQSSNSTLLAWVARGDINGFVAPVTDNKGNTYSMIGNTHTYGPLWPGSGEAMYVAPQAVGGSNHIVTTGITTGADEVTLGVIEVKNGGTVDAKWNMVRGGASQTSSSITTTGPATLIAVWAGDGARTDMTAVPNNGFTVAESQLINTTCAIQTVIAYKEVTAGTYDVTWTTDPVQGANMWIIAVSSGTTPPPPPPADTTAPSVPTNLIGTAVSTSQINLSWNASTDNVGVTGYQVFRNGTLIGSPTGTSYSDTGLAASTAYSYTVKALDAAGNVSAASTAASTSTLDVPPPPPTGGLNRVDLKNQLIFETANSPISVTTTSLTPPNNSLLVANVLVINDQTSGNITLSGGGLTWTKRQTFVSPNTPWNYTFVHEVWTAPVTTGAPMTITVSGTGSSGSDPARVNIQAMAFTGYDTANPIGAMANGSNLGAAAATITLSGAPSASSVVVASRATSDLGSTNSTATPGADWTEVYDQASSSGYGDLQSMVRGNSTSPSVTWANIADPAGADLWEESGFALEIRAAN